MLFSVIVANYNNGQFLQELVASVRNQTYSNWELVIVDDCSADDSKNILQQFSDDTRIKVVFHEQNRGAAQAFKTAASKASGEIIGMLGADDALVPEAIEIMVNAHLQNPNASLICSNLFQCDEQLNVIAVWDKYSKPEGWGSLIRNSSVGSFATFKKASYNLTEGFDPFFRKALDHDIYLKLEEQGEVIYIDKPLYLYRANPIGISQNINWFEATMFSLIGRERAYKRRKNIDGIINLNTKEYNELVTTWYKRKASLERRNKKYMSSFYYHLKSMFSQSLS